MKNQLLKLLTSGILLFAFLTIFPFTAQAAVTTVAAGAGTLSAAVTAAASGDILELAGDITETGDVTLLQSVTIRPQAGLSAKPKVTMKRMLINASGLYLTLSGIEFIGVSGAAEFLDYGSATTYTTSNIKILDCIIHNYIRGFRLSRPTTINLDTFVFDRSTIYDKIAVSGNVYETFGFTTKTTVKVIHILNSTIYNNGAGMISVQKTSATDSTLVLIDKCTFFGNVNLSRAFLAMNNSAGAKIRVNFSNNIVVSLLDPATAIPFQVTNTKLIINNSLFYKFDATAGTANYSNLVISANLALYNNLFTYPNFADSAARNFTLPVSSTLMTAGYDGAAIGAPKWVPIPAAPTVLTATNITQTSFDISWSASTGAAFYYLDVSTASDFSSFVPGFNGLKVGNVTSYPVTGLSPTTSYYYRIRAYNTGGSSTSSVINQNTAVGISTDATLSELKVGGISVPAFTPGTITYNVTLPAGTTLAPAITATSSESHATLAFTQPSSVNGTAKVVVTAQDGTTTQTYTINLSAVSLSGDASLSALYINNILVTGFAPGTFTYNISTYTAGTAISTVPITYTINESHATAFFTAPTEIPGVGTIVVIAQDGLSRATYTVNFKVTDATLSELKVGGTTVTGFTSASPGKYKLSWPNDGTIPVITYTPTEPHATALVTIQPGVIGDATVVVTAQDGTTTKTYTITFNSNDASLRDLQVNGTTIAGFSPSIIAYTINYPIYNVLQGSVALPVVTAVLNDTRGKLTPPTAITAFPSTSIIAIEAQDGTKVSYTIYFGITTGVNDITEQQLKISSKAGAVDILSGYNILSLQVADIQGKKVLAKNINSTEASVSTLGWVNGIYIFSLVTENGVITRKIGIFQ